MKLQEVKIKFKVDEPRIMKNRADLLIKYIGWDYIEYTSIEAWEIVLKNVIIEYKTQYGIPRLVINNVIELPISIITEIV